MSLSREKAEALGLAFSHEDESFPSDPAHPVYFADATIDGHTERFQGKSEQDVIDRFESVRRTRGLSLEPNTDDDTD